MSHLRLLILFGILFELCCCCFVYFVFSSFFHFFLFHSIHNTSQRKPPNLGTRSLKIDLLLGFSKTIWTLNWKSFKTIIARSSGSPFSDLSLHTIFIQGQSRPNGRKNQFFGSYFLIRTDFQNRGSRGPSKSS